MVNASKASKTVGKMREAAAKATGSAERPERKEPLGAVPTIAYFQKEKRRFIAEG